MTSTLKPTPNQRLRSEREHHCWSQQELADKVGTTPLNISRWERGLTLPGPYFRQKLCEVFEKSVQELGLVPESTDESRPAELSRPATTPITASTQEIPQTFWNVPYGRNFLFTGREDILGQLRAALTSEEQPIALAQPQAISGLGGIGKTQTAVEYAYRYRDTYDAVFWARADSHDLLVSDFLLIASLLNLPQRNEPDQGVVVNAVKRWLDTHEHWLLILDNADNIEMVSEFIPSTGTGHVLLTTRAHSTGTIAQRIELDKMELEEGTLFLLRRAKLLKSTTPLQTLPEAARSQAHTIVEAVGGLPLALDQAGAYIEETGCSLSDYLKFYKTRRSRLLRMRGRNATGHPEPVATTWSLSFEKIEQANPAAAELLRLCAFLHPDEIPETMIIEGASELGPVLQPVAEDELDLNEAIRELHKYSLVKRDPEFKILNIHRLVQVVLKDGMEKETQQEWAQRTVRMVNKVFPEVGFANWSKCQQYLPHAQVCAELIDQWNMISCEAIRLLTQVGTYLDERGQYAEAEPFLQQALTICEQALGPTHLEVARSANNLASLYRRQGKYDQGELLYKRAIMIRERILGSEHPDVAQSLNGLAYLYREQGMFVQAESLFEQVAAIHTQVLGSEHPDVAESLNDLAMVRGDLGKIKEEDKLDLLYKQALAIWERTLGPDHPDVARCLNNIGWHYYRQGRYDLVEAPHLRALSIFERGQGANHPYVALSLNALGLLYRDQGKYAKAEPFFQRALMIREQALGPDHVDVAQSLQNLGALYYRQGKYDLAEPLLKRSLNIREQLGPDNLLVAYSLNPLAILYRDQGRYEEAEKLFQRALAIREPALGKDNIDVAYTLAALAVLYYRQGKYDEAETLFKRALAIQEQVLEPEHPSIAQCLHDLAVLYYGQGKYIQAEPLFQRALSIREHVLGLEHPDTVATLNTYIELLHRTGRETEAAALEAHAQTVERSKNSSL